jgi:cell division protein FtsB
MTTPTPPAVTLTQPRIAFLMSLVALAGLVYTGTNKLVRTQIEFEALKESYVELKEGQDALKDEVKSLRDTVDGEIRHMTLAINRLTDTLEVTVGEATQ